MGDRKAVFHLFTISDYAEEEVWLREKHRAGWKLVRQIPPCLYLFERCTPEDVVYRLDYTNNTEDGEYYQLFRDYGWEYCGHCVGWKYFRKPVGAMDSEQDAEIFSDDASRVAMLDHLIKTRIVPLLILFFCAVIPGLIRNIGVSPGLSIFFAVMFLLYLLIFLHCGLKLRRLRKKYAKEE